MNNQNNLQPNEPVQSSKNIWTIIISIIITAIIIGGGIYIWQKSEVNKLDAKFIQIQKLLSDQKEEITELNTEITQLNNQLSELKNKKDLISLGELDNWETYINKRDSYSIMLPPEFITDDSIENLLTVANYDVDDPRYERFSPEQLVGIVFDIRKSKLTDLYDALNVNSLREAVYSLKDIEDPLINSAKDVVLGNFIVLFQDSGVSPEFQSLSYFAFDEKNNNYYDIQVFKPGYSKNKELIEKILATFKIL